MAAPNPTLKNILDEDDDEDQQIVFKRRNSASKPTQQNSALKKQPSQPSGSAVKRVASSSPSSLSGRVTPPSKMKVPLSNGAIKRNGSALESDDSEDDKPLTSRISQGNKASIKPPVMTKDSDDSEDEKPLVSRVASASTSGPKGGEKSAQKPSQKSSVDVKDEAADSEDEKPLSLKFASASSLGQNSKTKPVQRPSQKSSVDVKDEAEDSEDEKPLSLRGASASSSGLKSKQKPVQKTSQKSSVYVKDEAEDSEDEKPLSLRVASASSLGQKSKPKPVQKPSQKSSADVKKEADDSEDEKPLASRFQQNGSNKRPPSSAAKASQPANKKAKPSDSTPVKAKRDSSIKELKSDDDDDTDDDEDEDEYIPISQRTKNLASKQKTTTPKKVEPKVKATSIKKGTVTKKPIKNSKASGSFKLPPGSGEGQKWTTLEHCGVIFPPPYKPHGVKMLYNGKPVDLTPEQEEVATMFAVMKETEYATKKTFIENFMSDWKAILGPNHVIKQFELCDFTPIYEWSLKEKEKKKQMTTEEKKALKEEKLKQEEKYMWAVVDGVKEKVGNFRVEPPGLFRGRGEHPKMGKLKRRIRPRDITINIGKNAPIPECPIPGERWKEVRHDNTVTWLAFWNDPINSKEMKYVFLAASSSLKGQSDKEKYEKARKLKDYIQSIRRNYTRDFANKDDTKRQVAVATYLIDKLALRAGNEKEEGEEADTVGCCTLKVENVMLVPPNKLQFDFLGKDSIRYFNTVEVEPAVYKAVGELRMKNQNGKKKEGSDPLFHMLDTSKLNAHLKELMPGLTAKVFRTYNASITLDEMLNEESKPGTVPEKLAVYQQANKEVAIICNHQRSVSKSHDAQMSRLNEKLEDLKSQREELGVDLSRAKKGKPPLKDSEGKIKRNLSTEALQKKIMQLDSKIEKIEIERKLKEDLKTVALGTSKINYLDPRISVAWCKRNEVPIEKIFNKSLLAKFAWAMDVVPDFRF